MFFIFLAVIVSLSILIFFHEFGHFLFAKIFGIKVEEFSFGYPPRIFGLVRKPKLKIFFGKKIPETDDLGTIYSLNWIPFGGLNRLKDEFGETKKQADSFSRQPWWKQGIVALGGVVMNIFLTVLLLSIGFSLGLPQAVTKEISEKYLVKNTHLEIIYIEPSSPAEQAGLKIGDQILAIDQQNFQEVEEVQNYIKNKVSQPIKMKIFRSKNIFTFDNKEEFSAGLPGQGGGSPPEADAPLEHALGEKELETIPQSAAEIFESKDQLQETGGAIGIGLAKVGLVYYPWPRAIWQGIKTTFFLIWQMIIGLYLIFKNLIVHQKMIGGLVGIVGLSVMTAQAAQIGFVYLLQFVAFISLALAICQLIPFPALDGGRILFIIISGLKGKPVNQKIEQVIHNLGFIILIGLMIIVTYRELMRFGGKILQGLKQLII